jgi:hypothetical protein
MSFSNGPYPQLAGGNLPRYMDNRRSGDRNDRRAHPRFGRRDGEQRRPWYMRRRVWLAAASLMYLGWRRIRTLGRSNTRNHSDVAA